MNAVALEPGRVDFDLLREAFDRTSIGMAVVSPEGILQQVNGALCRMTGYAAAEIEGKSFQALVHPADVARDEQYLA
ncbi:MAG: PAS domain S-box protein, partial [Usitatibacter sp.]